MHLFSYYSFDASLNSMQYYDDTFSFTCHMARMSGPNKDLQARLKLTWRKEENFVLVFWGVST